MTSAVLTDVVRAEGWAGGYAACVRRPGPPGLNPPEDAQPGAKADGGDCRSRRGSSRRTESDMGTHAGGAPGSFTGLEACFLSHGRLINLVPGSVGTLGDQPGNDPNLPSSSKCRAGGHLWDRATVPAPWHRIPIVARSPRYRDSMNPIAERTTAVGGGRRWRR